MIELKLGKKFIMDQETSKLLGFDKESEYRVVGVFGNEATIQIGEKTITVKISKLIDHSKNMGDTISFKTVDYVPQNMLAAQAALNREVIPKKEENKMSEPEVIIPGIEKTVINVVPPVQPEPEKLIVPEPVQPVVENKPDENKTTISPQDNQEEDSNPYGSYIK